MLHTTTLGRHTSGINSRINHVNYTHGHMFQVKKKTSASRISVILYFRFTHESDVVHGGARAPQTLPLLDGAFQFGSSTGTGMAVRLHPQADSGADLYPFDIWPQQVGSGCA